MADETLLTTKDVMARLKISRPTVYKLTRNGTLVPVNGNKPSYLARRTKLLFKPEDVERLLTEK